jgi:inhibitor of KinA sporulation pathway (predicted exonuclease)
MPIPPTSPTDEHITSNRHDLSKLTPNVREQRYAFLCVVDFEASINESDGTHEVTESPLVLLSTATPSLDVVDEFHTFVRPQRNANWRDHKGIPQRVFDESPTFPEAWQNLLTFLDRYGATESNTLAITVGIGTSGPCSPRNNPFTALIAWHYSKTGVISNTRSNRLRGRKPIPWCAC